MSSEERRRHQRENVLSAIMISPNGHENRAMVYDLSESGARVGLPADFEHEVGAGLRLFFMLDDNETIVLNAHIVRVAIDHLGVQFAPAQESDIRYLMSELVGR
jgi:hypothetical protein